MKKLVFAAVAALALVSVGSVFANKNVDKQVPGTVMSDTTVTSTPAPADTVVAE